MTKRMLFAPVLLLFLAAWFGWFGPRQLGGPATYVSVAGFSMEPTLYWDDLVVLREQPDYEAGEVVAYRVEGGYVIHRIVSGDGDGGYVLRGDNRNRVDEPRPTREQVAGKLWLQVPGAGGWLRQLREPVNFGVLAMALALVTGVGGRELRRRRRRRRSRQMRNPAGQDESGADGSSRRPSGDRWWRRAMAGDWRSVVPQALMGAIGLGLALAVVFGALAFASLGRDAERSEYVERVQYEHEAALEYEVRMDRSSLYPGGVFRPRGPAQEAAAFEGVGSRATTDSFATRLASEIEVMIHYELVSAAFADPAVDPGALVGEVSAVLEIQAGSDGWTQVRPLIGPQGFRGPTVDVTGTLNLRTITALVERIEKETGIAPSQYELRIVPTIALDGSIDDEPLRETFEPVFTMAYNETQVRTQERLVRGEPVSVGQNATVAERVSYPGVDMTVREARQVATVGLVGSLAAVLVAGGLLYLGIGADEDAHIRNRYRSRLVAVATTGAAYTRDTIRLASIQDLARVADRSGGLILHETGHRGTRYFVPDGDEVYEYETLRGDRAGRGRAVVEAP